MELVADDEHRQQHRRETQVVRSSTAQARDNRILPDLEPLSWLWRSERDLLEYFIENACSQVVCSSYGHRVSLNLLIPLALRSPPLLYATLAYSASQRANVGLASAHIISRYIGLSLTSLQTEMPRSDYHSHTSNLAASLMLLLVDISSGSGSWRVYAEGANALLTSIRDLESKTPTKLPAELENILDFLSRWFLKVKSLASLTSAGLRGVLATNPDEATVDVCGIHFGYPTVLGELLGEIGAAVWGRRRQLSGGSDRSTPPTRPPTRHDFEIFEIKAVHLHMRLDKITRDTLGAPTGLKFYHGVRKGLSDKDVKGFEACVQAFLCMSRILIERRVRGTPASSLFVQTTVRAVIEAVKSIPTSSGSSPAIAIAPPLFIAGCNALKEEDRRDVREVFQAFIINVPLQSVKRALEILEALWEKDTLQDWWAYTEARNWDFLLY